MVADREELNNLLTKSLQLATEVRQNVVAMVADNIDAEKADLYYLDNELTEILKPAIIGGGSWKKIKERMLELKGSLEKQEITQEELNEIMDGSSNLKLLIKALTHPGSIEETKFQDFAEKVLSYRSNILALADGIQQVGKNLKPTTLVDNNLNEKAQLLSDLNAILINAMDNLQRIWSTLTQISNSFCYLDNSRINIGTKIERQTLDFFMQSTIGHEYQRQQNNRSFLYPFFKSSSREKQVKFLQAVASNHKGNNEVLRGALLLVRSQIECHSPFRGNTTFLGNHGSDLKRLIDKRLMSDRQTMKESDDYYLDKLETTAIPQLNNFIEGRNHLIERRQSHTPSTHA